MAWPVLEVAATSWEEGCMPQALLIQEHSVTPMPNREKALKILSKSIYRELRQNGYEPKQIVALATEIISLVTSDIKEDSKLD